MNIHNSFLFISLSWLLTACSTTMPTSYYLLKAMDTTQIHKGDPRLKDISILVKPVKVPEYLDRPQIAYRENDIHIYFSEFHRWAEPLTDNFTRVLTENLTTRIAPGHALRYSELDNMKSDYQLLIYVLRMDADESNNVVLKVKWTLWEEKNTAALIRTVDRYVIPFEKGSYSSIVVAQSKAVALFSDDVASFVRAQLPDINKGSTKRALD